jgi:tRNA(Ile)-lysidine synthase
VCWDELEDLPVALEMSTENMPFKPAMVDGKHVVAFSNDMMKCSQFVLRHWRQGDRFRPFGMKGSKLVSDLFVDLKLSASQKSAAWLLEADGKILWVLGYRAAHEFVVTPGTTDYVIFRYNSFS